jgi:hypothetical protein
VFDGKSREPVTRLVVSDETKKWAGYWHPELCDWECRPQPVQVRQLKSERLQFGFHYMPGHKL